MALITRDDIIPYFVSDSGEFNLTTTQETLLSNLINSVSQFIRSYVKKPIEPEDIVEYADIEEASNLICLQYFPIISVSEIRIDKTLTFSDNTIYNLDHFLIDTELGILYYKYGNLPYGRRIAKVSYTAGYSEIPADIKDVACQMVVYLFRKIDSKEIGVVNIAGYKENVTFVQREGLLPEFKEVLDMYKNVSI